MTVKKQSNEWPKTTRNLTEFLGRSRGRIQNLKKELETELIEGEDYGWRIKRGSPKYIVWNKSGVIKLAKRLNTKEAAKFLEDRGEKSVLRIREEQHYIDIIIAAINGFTSSIKKYNIDGYEIDLYLPQIKIAIECDEKGHQSYDKFEERFRQSYIEEKLNCKFIRFNPDETNFNIGKVINKIFNHIYN